VPRRAWIAGRSRKLEPTQLITHRFRFDDVLDAYDTFFDAAQNKALKLLIEKN